MKTAVLLRANEPTINGRTYTPQALTDAYVSMMSTIKTHGHQHIIKGYNPNRLAVINDIIGRVVAVRLYDNTLYCDYEIHEDDMNQPDMLPHGVFMCNFGNDIIYRIDSVYAIFLSSNPGVRQDD